MILCYYSSEFYIECPVSELFDLFRKAPFSKISRKHVSRNALLAFQNPFIFPKFKNHSYRFLRKYMNNLKNKTPTAKLTNAKKLM